MISEGSICSILYVFSASDSDWADPLFYQILSGIGFLDIVSFIPPVEESRILEYVLLPCSNAILVPKRNMNLFCCITGDSPFYGLPRISFGKTSGSGTRGCPQMGSLFRLIDETRNIWGN